jgi:tetratricopeptide (TPR) repeat protein
MTVESMQDRSLEYVNKAIESHDNPPQEYHLLRTELLLSEGRYEKAKEALDPVDPDQFDDEKTNDKARYYYTRGKVALRLENDDQAFFHFMDAVRSAPSSEWARQARETIEERL